jgi:hypothetical protein
MTEDWAKGPDPLGQSASIVQEVRDVLREPRTDRAGCFGISPDGLERAEIQDVAGDRAPRVVQPA